MQISDRAQAIKPSSTLAVSAKAKAMKAAGKDVVSFGAGEPDFDTPANIKAAAKKALDSGTTKYQPVPGTPAARQAVADYMNARHGYSFEKENVLISAGGKHSLYLAFMCTINPGDEVILPAPYWVSYPEQAKLAGAVVKTIHNTVEDNFKLTPQKLENALSDQSRVLVLNSPSNPTGTMYTPDELVALAEKIVKYPNLIVFSDEIYERLIYGDNKFQSFAAINPQIAKQTVTFSGLAKTYAMTGWRVGFTIGDASLIKAMSAMQGQMTSCITAFCFPAIVEALGGDQGEVEKMRQEFEKRGTHMHQRVSSLPGVVCPKPQGAFYLFPNISQAAYGKKDPNGKTINSAGDFASSLLEHADVAVVPGADFGAPDHIRLSFATSMEQIDKGIDRIEKYLKNLS